MIVGDVYHLLDDLGEIPAGLWVVIDVGMMVTLSRLGENEDGDLCTTHRVVKVTRDEMAQFIRMELLGIDKWKSEVGMTSRSRPDHQTPFIYR